MNLRWPARTFNCQARRRTLALPRPETTAGKTEHRLSKSDPHSPPRSSSPPSPIPPKPRCSARDRASPDNSIYEEEKRTTHISRNPTRGIIVKMHSLATKPRRHKTYPNTCQNTKRLYDSLSVLTGRRRGTMPLAHWDTAHRKSVRLPATDCIFDWRASTMPVGVGGGKVFEATWIALDGPEHRGASRARDMPVTARMLTRWT